MRKFAITAASLAFAGLLTAGPAAADIELDVCFDILDQLSIEHDSDDCSAVVEATLVESQQGPYVIQLDTIGNLICTALEVKYVNEYSPIYGKIVFDPIPTCVPADCAGEDCTCAQTFKLTEIGPDAAACGTATE